MSFFDKENKITTNVPVEFQQGWNLIIMEGNVALCAVHLIKQNLRTCIAGRRLKLWLRSMSQHW